MTRIARILTTIALCASALWAGAARAGTDTGTVNVSATVPDVCVIGNATLAFGSYDPLVANVSAPLDATTTLTISCTGGTPWAVGLGNGGNFVTQRRLRSGADYLAYELYLNAARSVRWGDTGTTDRASGTLATTSSQVLTIYGRVPQAQLPSAGSYSDTVTATIYF